MKTYNQKEAWVLNKRSGVLDNGTLLLDGIQPYMLVKGDNSMKIGDNHIVYYNKEEAVEARSQYKLEIKELCAETKRNIKKLNGIWLESMTSSDYLPDELLNRKSSDEYYDICELLTNFIENGMININAVSFSKESVSHVNWGETAAEIVLKNGQKITTYDHTEFEFVSRIFGINYRDRFFTTIKPEKEEEDD